MPTCPNCGEIVMNGDICCPHCGLTFSSNASDSYYDETSDGVITRSLILESFKSVYEDSLKNARNSNKDRLKIQYYKESLKFINDYWWHVERFGFSIEGVPDLKNALSNSDIDACTKIHYDHIKKFSLFKDDIIEDCEEILNKTGNGDRISKNHNRLESERSR